MSSETYSLVFSGELVRGADLAQSKRNLAKLFKISDAKAEALFSGKPVTLKRGLDFPTATKYRVAIKKAGCRVDLVENRAEQNPEKSTDVQPVSNAVDNASNKASFVAKDLTSVPPSEGSADTDTPPLPIVEEMDAESSVAVSEVLGAAFSLAPAVGNLVDSSELDRLDPIQVEISGFSMKQGGGDLLDESEKASYVPRDVVVDAELAPVGEDLLSQAERDEVEVVEIDLSQFSVAEPGEDLGQIKDDKDALTPDISHLSLQ